MEYEERHGLYIGKPMGEYHILAILPQYYDLCIRCAISDGNIWVFYISKDFPDLKIGEVEGLEDMGFKRKDGIMIYYTEKVCVTKVGYDIWNTKTDLGYT